MFWYSIEGRVADPAELKRQHQRWLQDVAPGARGWLGNTSGVTDDGFAFLTAHYIDADAARETSDRPEQSDWWEATEVCFEGPVDFLSWDDVQVFLGGGSDDAGFVRVIRGRASDVERAKAALDALEGDVHERRSDVIGGLVSIRPDGDVTQIVYFSSEEEAWDGEAAMSDQGLRDSLDGTPRCLDLRDPWLASAPR